MSCTSGILGYSPLLGPEGVGSCLVLVERPVRQAYIQALLKGSGDRSSALLLGWMMDMQTDFCDWHPTQHHLRAVMVWRTGLDYLWVDWVYWS